MKQYFTEDRSVETVNTAWAQRLTLVWPRLWGAW
jgi:hypothetical protein